MLLACHRGFTLPDVNLPTTPGRLQNEYRVCILQIRPPRHGEVKRLLSISGRARLRVQESGWRHPLNSLLYSFAVATCGPRHRRYTVCAQPYITRAEERGKEMHHGLETWSGFLWVFADSFLPVCASARGHAQGSRLEMWLLWLS